LDRPLGVLSVHQAQAQYYRSKTKQAKGLNTMALDPRRVADIAQKMYGAVSGANGAMLNQE